MVTLVSTNTIAVSIPPVYKIPSPNHLALTQQPDISPHSSRKHIQTMTDFIATPSDMVDRYFDLARTIISNCTQFQSLVTRLLAIPFENWTDANHELALKIWNMFNNKPIPRLGSSEHILPVLTPAEREELEELVERVGNLESEVYRLYVTLSTRVTGYVSEAEREAADRKCKACLCN